MILLVGGFLHYTLPRQDVVRIANTEVRRVQVDNSWFYANNEPQDAQGTRDIKFISGIDSNDRERVYRNEDTGFGWPFFFKFNSSDVQARAASFTDNSGAGRAWVVVRYYGWRVQLYSVFPNALSVKQVDGPDAKPFPVFNVVVLTGLAALFGWLYFVLRRFKERRIDPKLESIADVFDGDDDSGTAPPTKASGKRSWIDKILGR